MAQEKDTRQTILRCQGGKDLAVEGNRDRSEWGSGRDDETKVKQTPNYARGRPSALILRVKIGRRGGGGA